MRKYKTLRKNIIDSLVWNKAKLFFFFNETEEDIDKGEREKPAAEEREITNRFQI